MSFKYKTIYLIWIVVESSRKRVKQILCATSLFGLPQVSFWYSMGGRVDVIAAGLSVPGGHSIQLVLDDARTVEGLERTNL